MSVKFPNNCNIKLTDNDRRRLLEASQKHEIPTATLARKVLRDWLRANGFMDNDQSYLQEPNPPELEKAC